jgi:hypothetical protein
VEKFHFAIKADAQFLSNPIDLWRRSPPVVIEQLPNYRTPVITFSYRGNTNSAGTIVVYNSNGRTKAQKCLAISLGLGIMRNGDYTGDVSSSVSASKCKKIT